MPNDLPVHDGKRPIGWGLDPSLTGTAVTAAVPVADGSIKYVTMRFTSPPAGKAVLGRIRRYEALTDYVMQFSDEYPPALVLIEDYIRGTITTPARRKEEGLDSRRIQSPSVIPLAEYGGILRSDLLTIPDIRVIDVAPATLKKFVTGVGKGRKEQMIAMVLNLWKVGFGTDDEFDSYGLARLCVDTLGLGSPDATAQECVNVVLQSEAT